jgi:hypothetical protein
MVQTVTVLFQPVYCLIDSESLFVDFRLVASANFQILSQSLHDLIDYHINERETLSLLTFNEYKLFAYADEPSSFLLGN